MFTERIVLFIDILGFGELVSNNAKDFARINEVYDEFNSMIKNGHLRFSQQTQNFENVQNRKLGIKGGGRRFDEKYQDLIFFSDCVVWTYPIDKLPKIDFHLILLSLCGALEILTATLFSKGITFRGGISIGNIYKANGKIFGDGLVKAYELEKVAIYPRIAFDKKIIDRVNPDIFKFFFKKKLIYSLKHKYYYLNYFDMISIFSGKLASSIDVNEIRMLKISVKTFADPVVVAINNGIEHEKECVRKKYQWLKAKLLSIENIEFYLKELK